jgi:hypothetical protein
MQGATVKIISLVALALLTQLAKAGTDFGHWTTGATSDKGAVYAATANDSGAIFGEYCFFSSKVCSWHLALDMKCEKGADYPVLANSDKGAISLVLTCVGETSGGFYQYVFKNWQQVENIAREGAMIGIATPLQSDQFKVYRFLLDGLNRSTRSVESAFFASVGTAPGKNTRPVSTQSETL